MEKKDKLILTAILFFITVFLFTDMIADWFDGVPVYHFAVQLTVIATALVGFYWIWKNNTALINIIDLKSEKITTLNDKNKELSYGLSLAIEKQFNDWQLTSTEKDIGFFLLKGFSLKEIAEYRQTAEITVRQQSAKIYQKAQLAGRTELSAFFMEDFLINPDSAQHQIITN